MEIKINSSEGSLYDVLEKDFLWILAEAKKIMQEGFQAFLDDEKDENGYRTNGYRNHPDGVYVTSPNGNEWEVGGSILDPMSDHLFYEVSAYWRTSNWCSLLKVVMLFQDHLDFRDSRGERPASLE